MQREAHRSLEALSSTLGQRGAAQKTPSRVAVMSPAQWRAMGSPVALQQVLQVSNRPHAFLGAAWQSCLLSCC